MDELLSLFNADDSAGDNDTSHQETQLATQTSKTKKYHSFEGAPSLSTTTNTNDFGLSFASAFATSNTNSRTTNEENILNKSRVVKQHQSYTATTATKSTTTITQKHKSNTSSCDPYTNFNITDRRTSRANMVNAFSTLTYKSCSVLAASSRAEWNTFMVDGGSSNGAPSGKTKLATCGILTQDVSSKLSSKTGRAFAKLLLGDLPSSSSSSNNSSNAINPSITVFLFGDAINILKSNMKYMKAGYAIAILQPSLMPNNNTNNGGSGTSITLSINNPNHLLAIGRASDCSKCKGSMRVRTQSEYGGVKWEDVRCTTLVDTRFGGYCDKHKRQGLGSKGSSGSNKGSNNSMTFMQKQRAQDNQQQGISQMRSNNNRGDVWVGQRGGHTNASSFNNLGHQGRRSTSNSLSEALSQSGILGQQSTQQSISSLGDSQQQLLKRAPLHMKKSQPIASSTTTGASNKPPPTMAGTSNSSTTKNPYSSKSSQQASQTKPSNPRKRKEVDDILGEALDRTRSIDKPNHRPGKMKKKKTSLLLSSTTTKRPVKVFTTEGYDGSVHVPKPNKLLFQRGASSSAASSMITPSPDNNRISSALILDKQRNLAELLKRKQGSISTTSGNMKRGLSINKDTLAKSKQKIVSTTAGGIKVVKRTTNSFQSKTNKYNDFASAFGSTGSGGSLSTEADVMNAKSRFSSVTNAQEYARARAQVQELEAREATKEGYNQRKKNKNKSSDVAIRTTGWACRTCKKTTPFKPVACIKSRHDVRQKREIKGQETLSSRKDRLDRHGKDDKEGGLTLGSGVEWTRLEWSRGGL